MQTAKEIRSAESRLKMRRLIATVLIFGMMCLAVQAGPTKKGPLNEAVQDLFNNELSYKCVFSGSIGVELVGCETDDVLRYVWIKNGVAYLEVNAYPNANTSGIWQGIDRPMAKIIAKFPTVKRWAFSMRGWTVSGDSAPRPCANSLCFVFSPIRPSDPDAGDKVSTYGVIRIPK